MKWELDALKILARNPSVPSVALLDTIAEIEKLTKKLGETRAMLKKTKAENDKLKTCQRWIACAERMPERGQVVLMWIQPHSYIPGNAKEGAYMPQINMVTPWRSTWDMAVYGEEDITHWRPMPERPEAQA